MTKMYSFVYQIIGQSVDDMFQTSVSIEFQQNDNSLARQTMLMKELMSNHNSRTPSNIQIKSHEDIIVKCCIPLN